jgi:hypothetical protein
VVLVVLGKVGKKKIKELLRDRHAPSVEPTGFSESFDRCLQVLAVGMRPAVGVRE